MTDFSIITQNLSFYIANEVHMMILIRTITDFSISRCTHKTDSKQPGQKNLANTFIVEKIYSITYFVNHLF